MKERPILFSGPMVRAILEDRKTQTRKVVKPQPPPNCAYLCVAMNGWAWSDGSTVDYDYFPKDREALMCPYGVPGDRIWVRETFTLQCDVDGDAPPFSDGRPIQRMPDDYDFPFRWLQPHYKATDPEPELACERPNCENNEPHCHWNPSIHMPRWASRITLEITEVRVQRLQEISEEDAKEEGVPFLWVLLNAKRGFGWKVNPWVWAINFKRVSA